MFVFSNRCDKYTHNFSIICIKVLAVYVYVVLFFMIIKGAIYGLEKTKRIYNFDYNHVISIIIYGVEFLSSYNHNYYYNKNTGDLILEETNDDQTCYYYRVEVNGYSFVKNYLGFTDDQYGIFDDDYEGYPSRNENGVIELDSEMR